MKIIDKTKNITKSSFVFAILLFIAMNSIVISPNSTEESNTNLATWDAFDYQANNTHL